MEIRQTKRGDTFVIAPIGRIDSTTSDAVDKAVNAALEAGERKLIVDFSGVDYISSAGLRVLLVAAKRLSGGKGSFELESLGESVRQVFDLAGFLPLFKSTGAAISSGPPPSPQKKGDTGAGAQPAKAAGDGGGKPLLLHVEAPGGSYLDRSFTSESVVVGRSEQADITVTDHSVSRRHARIFRQGADWSVEDLGSRNGTLLNEQRLAAASVLKPGDVIRVGDTRVVLATPGMPTGPVRAAAIDPAAAGDSMVSVLRPAAELMKIGGSDAGASSRLRLLNEVHRALARPISRAELLDLILERAFEVLQPEDAAIFLRGADGELYKAAERRSPNSSSPLLVSRRLAEEVTVKGAAALVLDAQIDSRFSGAESILASGVRSIVAAPLLDADGCLGMIALYSRMHVRRFAEQDLELLVSLAAAAALRVRNIALVEEAAKRQVLDRELALAHDIQMGMLSRRVPQRPEVDLGAALRPARNVGGDLYDMIMVGDHLWFIVGDVAGKGIAAALLMAVAQTLFRAIASSGLSLSEVAAQMNRELCRENDRAMFVTAFAGRLDLRTGDLQVVNAGHNLPYWVGRDRTLSALAVAGGPALGVVDGSAFQVTDLRFQPDEGLVIYTDGVCDALDPAGASFGTPRIERALAAAAAEPASRIVHRMFEAVDLFAGAAPQEDDITVVAIRYRPSYAARTDTGGLTVESGLGGKRPG
jgi:sigma-B regulation protein RsbU (phosphoserine phosphatase)